MGSIFSYEHAYEYPVCEKVHNLFKGPEDYYKNHANSIMIRNGDPEYINVIIKRYGFKNKNDNMLAYARDVLSGWDHWKFPIEPGKARISTEILKLIDKYYRSYTKCKYALDFEFFNQKIKDKVEMDIEFIEICIDILTDVDIIYTDTKLKNQLKHIDIFLEEWKNYSKHYHIYNSTIHTKIKTICNNKKIKISKLLTNITKESKKKSIQEYNYDEEQRRQREDDDDEEQRRQQEEREREMEIEREREDYEFYYGDN